MVISNPSFAVGGSRPAADISGEFVDFAGERYYVIRNVDRMPPFFISVISDVDHWLFVSSTGGLTAGRISPETALFPYVTVDKIHDSAAHTGCKTLINVGGDATPTWEPFNREHTGRFVISRHLYKSVLGNKLCFEEINHDLALVFRYLWATSDEYGFVRHCEVENLGNSEVTIQVLDGLLNVLPAGTPRFAQTNTSNLVDAYKWSELDAASGLALFTLYSGITDRAAPSESLRANTVCCLGLDDYKVLLSTDQLDDFRQRTALRSEEHTRGIRGAYLVNVGLSLHPGQMRQWQLVADIERSQSDVVKLRQQLADPARFSQSLQRSVDKGSDALARIMARSDGFQLAAQENVVVHHYANVLFNILRGGIFDDQYRINTRDLTASLKRFNRDVLARNRAFLASLPEQLQLDQLLTLVRQHGDLQLERLCSEYLPITFGRRHGDPSRPWNQFEVRLKDDSGHRLLSYQGNWRDIFQNWEALAFSYPAFVESMIAKFVNASTIDGYNPYRITHEGIDWEVEEPDDPWSYIGYWGDHQIIYLQKLLELSSRFHPARLTELLHRRIFCYANVPYRIKPFDALLADPKSTVVYDEPLAERIDERVARIGSDGKLVLTVDGGVYRVNLLEKLLVAALCKLSNLVVGGGIWMNTQRPEWNDANNALVGQGLSMVTLYYLRRYISFLQQLLAAQSGTLEISAEVKQWLTETAGQLAAMQGKAGAVDAAQRHATLVELGQAASRYRLTIYQQETFSSVQSLEMDDIRAMLVDAMTVIDQSIGENRRDDGLYHAYNLLDSQADETRVKPLYPMLEGQVAVLSAGLLPPEEAAVVVEALFDSEVYRPDQHSFMLYPDRPLPGFLARNRVPAEAAQANALLQKMLAAGDERILTQDAEACYRFNADFTNVDDLKAQLDRLADDYGDELVAAREPLLRLFEQVFDHQSFTGRSGGMFGFEGLGCIYWHMVAKLLLAIQENYFAALDQDAPAATCSKLGELYYRVREGIGFNKTPDEYGAFPTDPYSHTPKHAGAQQPGMTGQVKEEILSRFGELGVRVDDGAVRFQPALLRACEFTADSGLFRFLDVDDAWQSITVPCAGLAFTWCQVPIIYRLDPDSEPGLTLVLDDGTTQSTPQSTLSSELSSELFLRSGRIRRIEMTLHPDQLFDA